MVDKFLKTYIQKIVSKPDDVDVIQNISHDGNLYNITIRVNEADIGRIIGKNGKMISSIKVFISACKAKDKIGYKIAVESI